MPDVLFVSKPVAPPWDDGNKNLVRDVATSMQRYRPRVMVPRGSPLRGVESEGLYASAGEYRPSRWSNARVLARLIGGAQVDLWHFFFAPNRLTLRAGAIARRVRGTPCVHTIASAPDDLEHVARMLFADRIIALSARTAARLSRLGVRAVQVPPALRAPTVTRDEISASRARHGLPATYVLYAGDLEGGDGAETFVRAASVKSDRAWVIASRPKTPRAAHAETALRARASEQGTPIVWLGRIDDIHAVVAGAACVVLSSNTLQAKIDWPLVLLEALSLSVPVIVAKATPAEELAESGGATVIASGDPRALVDAVDRWAGLAVDERVGTLSVAAAWVRSRCNPAAVASAYEAVYDELIDSRARDARSEGPTR